MAQPPNPNWVPGQKINSPVGEMVSLDPSTLDATATYKLMIGSIVPRPIAFVSTMSKQGICNLAPFSYFNAIATQPPCVMISLTPKSDGQKKDTLRNIEETRQFVVNTVSEWMAEPMNYCSAEYPYGVDEFKKSGLTAIPSVKIKPPRVKESPVHFECELFQILVIGDSTIIIGQIVMVHVSQAAYENGKIKISELKPIARLGGPSYGRVDGIFDLPRPKV